MTLWTFQYLFCYTFIPISKSAGLQLWHFWVMFTLFEMKTKVSTTFVFNWLYLYKFSHKYKENLKSSWHDDEKNTFFLSGIIYIFHFNTLGLAMSIIFYPIAEVHFLVAPHNNCLLLLLGYHLKKNLSPPHTKNFLRFRNRWKSDGAILVE